MRFAYPTVRHLSSARSCSVIVAPQAVKIEAVSKVSTLRKLGVAARVAQEQAGRSRTWNAVVGAARTTARSFGSALHQLWLEVTGVVFLVIAVFGGVEMVREYAKYHAGQAPAGHVALAVCFTALFVWFGVSSFARARKKSQRA
jgi:hypothetical protein